jgi:hypothetical protein
LEAALTPGGEAEGWVPYLVGQGESNLILVVDEIANFADDRYRFIALDDGAALGVDPALASIAATGAGSDASSPAAQNETVVAEDWEITLLEVARGEDALATLQAVSTINAAPEAGLEYILVRARVRYIGTEDVTESVDSFNFTVVDSAGTAYDSPIVIGPDPQLEASLYPGGQIEGWFAVTAPQGQSVALMFSPLFDLDGTNTRYIALQ